MQHYPVLIELDLDVEITVSTEQSEEKFHVKGRVDRVDVSVGDNGVTFVVNDYKPTVEQKYRLQEIMTGTLSQMPIYLEATRVWLQKHHVTATPWAALYRSFGKSIHKTDEPQNRIAMKDPACVVAKTDPGVKLPDWKTHVKQFSLKPLTEQNHEVLTVIGGIAHELQSGEFAVRPLQSACNTCDYNELCRVDEWGKG